MKTVRIMIIALVTLFTFGAAKAQVHVTTRVGETSRHRTIVVHRPHHRRVVVVHRPRHRRVIVEHHSTVYRRN